MTDSTADQLVADNLGLARKLAWSKAKRGGQPVEDLLQDAMVGLIKASRSWQPEQGVPFGAYAQIRIVGEMRDGLRRMDIVHRRCLHPADAPYLTPGPSLDAVVDARRGPKTLADLIPEQGSSVEDVAVEHDLVRWVLDRCDDRERAVFVAYFFDGRLLREIAVDLGLTESRVSQIIKAAGRRIALIDAEEGAVA